MAHDGFNFKEFDRWFTKPILFFVLGCLLIAVVLEEENKWIAVPVVLAGSALILGSLSALALLFEIRYRIKEEQKRSHTFLSQEAQPVSSVKKQKAVYQCMLVLMFIASSGITLSGSLIENYINWKAFAGQVGIAAIISAYLFSKLFYYAVAPVFEDKKREEYVQLYTYVVPFLLCFNAAILYNQFAAPLSKKTEKAVVDQVDKKGEGAKGYIFLNFDGNTQQFEFLSEKIIPLNDGDTVMVTIQRGALGYEYVSGITAD